MSNQDNIENPEEEFDKDLSFELPNAIRWTISIPTILLIVLILGIYVYLIFCDPDHIDPDKFGLPTTLVVLIVILIVINLPWGKMGFRIKKVGMIELENVVKTQARGNSKELADLQQQIDELKAKLLENTEHLNTDNSLDDLVKKFLTQYSQWAFSALRIKKWGALQSGFEGLKKYDTQQIRESLRRLLSKNIVATKISKKGNTIYKIQGNR